jgi:hypothetical protein
MSVISRTTDTRLIRWGTPLIGDPVPIIARVLGCSVNDDAWATPPADKAGGLPPFEKHLGMNKRAKVALPVAFAQTIFNFQNPF